MSNFSNLNLLPLPPGSFGLPIIGETIPFFQDSKFVQKHRQKYGNIFKTHLFGCPTVFVIDEQINRFILMNEEKYFVSAWPKSTRVLLGNYSLTTNAGEFHTSRRRLIYQAFKPRALASYIPTIEKITQQYLQKWETIANLTWYSELRRYTFDVACTLFVGQEKGSNTVLFSLFEEWCSGLFSLPLNLPQTRFGKALKCRYKLLNVLEQIILERQQQENLGNDALGILLNTEDEKGEKLSLAELKDQILVLLFAGHETLTSSVTSFCLLMTQYPDIFMKVEAEQKALNYPEFTLDTLKEMTYLEQVLKEVLRLIPPVGGVFREVIQSCEFNGFQIPQGWRVLCSIKGMHEDEKLYFHVKQFNPERFAPHLEINPKSNNAYIPFGGGIRECIGKEFARLESKILAAMLARHYDWTLRPNQNLELVMIPSPRPRDGLKVCFQKSSSVSKSSLK